jgi:hypothetical protein
MSYCLHVYASNFSSPMIDGEFFWANIVSGLITNKTTYSFEIRFLIYANSQKIFFFSKGEKMCVVF